ncbi:hypothetical protein FOZ63_030373, partial [Perkinsus olseni]
MSRNIESADIADEQRHSGSVRARMMRRRTEEVSQTLIRGPNMEDVAELLPNFLHEASRAFPTRKLKVLTTAGLTQFAFERGLLSASAPKRRRLFCSLSITMTDGCVPALDEIDEFEKATVFSQQFSRQAEQLHPMMPKRTITVFALAEWGSLKGKQRRGRVLLVKGVSLR